MAWSFKTKASLATLLSMHPCISSCFLVDTHRGPSQYKDAVLPLRGSHYKINSFLPGDAWMRQWTGSSLVHIMPCHLFCAKPLPEPILAYCQLKSWEQISMKLELEFYHFHSWKYIWKGRLPNWRTFCPGGDDLRLSYLYNGNIHT